MLEVRTKVGERKVLEVWKRREKEGGEDGEEKRREEGNSDGKKEGKGEEGIAVGKMRGEEGAGVMREGRREGEVLYTMEWKGEKVIVRGICM